MSQPNNTPAVTPLTFLPQTYDLEYLSNGELLVQIECRITYTCPAEKLADLLKIRDSPLICDSTDYGLMVTQRLSLEIIRRMLDLTPLEPLFENFGLSPDDYQVAEIFRYFDFLQSDDLTVSPAINPESIANSDDLPF
jgi:hypothetical protein